jgi:UDP-N-acetyl-D-glucosamine dehydrogenase
MQTSSTKTAEVVRSSNTVTTARKGARAPKNKYKKPKIAVIGLGYVGLPLALRADTRGFDVVGFDINTERIQMLAAHRAPEFLGPEEKTQAGEHTMDVSSDPSALADVDTYIICVPTPVNHAHEPDLEPLVSACRTIAPYIQRGSLVVVESTVNPGVCDEILLPMLEEISGLRPETDFLFAHCPERINPGDTRWNVGTIPRVLGGVGQKSTQAAHKLYASIVDAPIHLMGNIKEAEAVKITENSFRDINIAFVNELAMSFKKLGIDIVRVIEGASTKPFAFMPHYPGCGVGGHCIPVDPYYLISYARQNGFTHRFLEAAREINNSMPHYTISLLEDALAKKGKSLEGTRIALLGLSYKKDIPDGRESPAFEIEKELARRGAIVQSYDPYLKDASSVSSLEQALRYADAAVIATAHTSFTSLAPKDFLGFGIDIVIDGRNCLDKEAFVLANMTYHGIGR